MMSTKNLQFNCFPFPLVPLWRKAKFSCWKICALNSLWAFMALGRGSSPKKILFVGSCSSPRSFPKLLCRRESRFSCGNAEFLWNEKVEFPGWESFHQVKTQQAGKKNQKKIRMRSSGGKADGKGRGGGRGAAFAAFSPLQFSGHWKLFQEIKGIFPCACAACQGAASFSWLAFLTEPPCQLLVL